MTDQAQFISLRLAGVTVLDIRGEVDILNAVELRAAMQDAASSAGTGALVVSLEKVDYFDSQTLEIFVDFSKRLELSRRRMSLVAPQGSPPRRLLDLSGISAAIPTYDSVDEAAAALARASQS